MKFSIGFGALKLGLGVFFEKSVFFSGQISDVEVYHWIWCVIISIRGFGWVLILKGGFFWSFIIGFGA